MMRNAILVFLWALFAGFVVGLFLIPILGGPLRPTFEQCQRICADDARTHKQTYDCNCYRAPGLR